MQNYLYILYMQHNYSKKAQIILETVGQVIKEERIKHNKSQRLIADEYDIQKSLFSRLESGKNEPKLISLWAICEALDINISDFLKQVEEKLPKNFTLIDK